MSNRVTGADVRRVLAQVIGRRGTPQRIRSDNGSEFVCEALRVWQERKGVESLLVAPSSPWENGVIESFNACFQDEFLNGHEFVTAAESKTDERNGGASTTSIGRTVRWVIKRHASTPTPVMPMAVIGPKKRQENPTTYKYSLIILSFQVDQKNGEPLNTRGTSYSTQFGFVTAKR